MAFTLDECKLSGVELLIKNTFLEYSVKLPGSRRSSSEPPSRSFTRGAVYDSAVAPDLSVVRCASANPLKTSAKSKSASLVSEVSRIAKRDANCIAQVAARRSYSDVQPGQVPQMAVRRSYSDVQPGQVHPRMTNRRVGPRVSANVNAYDTRSKCSPYPSGAAVPVTTLMVCDIPCSVGFERFKVLLRDLGFDGKYDYLHFPKKTRDKNFKGYGFVNFFAAEDASRFSKMFLGYRFADIETVKQGRVEVARIQGSAANMSLHAQSVYEFDAHGLRV